MCYATRKIGDEEVVKKHHGIWGEEKAKWIEGGARGEL
jgi:hypothetical protein